MTYALLSVLTHPAQTGRNHYAVVLASQPGTSA
jgi:hypothetical protein